MKIVGIVGQSVSQLVSAPDDDAAYVATAYMPSYGTHTWPQHARHTYTYIGHIVALSLIVFFPLTVDSHK